MKRLIESFSINRKDVQELPVIERALVEASDGKKYETKKKYRVDVSRFIENLNNRVYSKKLWENVIGNQKHIWEGSFALADHPEDEGSFKDVMGVWSNLHINENTETVKADITFVGPYGAKAQEILEAGGKIGFSSSGFGDLKEDGKTVDENTYQIERIADCVLNPSQKVYGSIQDEIKDSVETKPTNSISEKDEKKEHVKMSANKQSKFEERRFRETIESYFSSLEEGVHSPDSKLKELKELLSYFDESSPVDLREKIETEISNTEAVIQESVKKAHALKETFGTDNPDEFKEGFSKLATETQLYERQADDWKKIAETLQVSIKELKEELDARPTVEQYENALASVKETKKHFIKKLNTASSLLNNKEKNLNENAKIYKEMVKELQEAYSKLASETKKSASLKEEVKVLTKTVSDLKEFNEDQMNVFKSKIKEMTALPEVKHVHQKEMFKHYNENSKVKSYYEDLERQHGKEILPFKEKILGCKTLFEAMRIYTNALAEMSASLYTIHTGDEAENRTLVESATNSKISHKRELNLPEGWN